MFPSILPQLADRADWPVAAERLAHELLAHALMRGTRRELAALGMILRLHPGTPWYEPVSLCCSWLQIAPTGINWPTLVPVAALAEGLADRTRAMLLAACALADEEIPLADIRAHVPQPIDEYVDDVLDSALEYAAAGA